MVLKLERFMKSLASAYSGIIGDKLSATVRSIDPLPTHPLFASHRIHKIWHGQVTSSARAVE